MVNIILVDYVGLYINWANNSLFIILAKLAPFIKVAIFSDVTLVPN